MDQKDLNPYPNYNTSVLVKGLVKFLYVVSFISILGLNSAVAQRYLQLRKSGSSNRIMRFAEGEEIRFRLKGDESYTRGLIQGFGEDNIRFHYKTINISNITEIDISRKYLVNRSISGASNTLFIAAGLYMATDQFNQTVINNEPAGVSTGTVITSASIVSAGLLLKLFKRNKFKINKGHRIIEIVDLTEGY